MALIWTVSSNFVYFSRTFLHLITIPCHFTAIKEQPFYFISAVYFCRVADGDYVPAELAISSYSFENGITNKYHTFIKPLTLPYGYAADARDHAAATHQLDVPPKAQGESNYGRIYDDIVRFIKPKNGFNQSAATKNNLVVFTSAAQRELIESILSQFALDDDVNDDIQIEVFPLEELFYVLKIKSMDVKNIQHRIKHIDISNSLLESIEFENVDRIACTVSLVSFVSKENNDFTPFFFHQI